MSLFMTRTNICRHVDCTDGDAERVKARAASGVRSLGI
jgi:hypothetical protein